MSNRCQTPFIQRDTLTIHMGGLRPPHFHREKMLQITKEYIERVHLDSARGGNHAAIDLISSAWSQPRGKTFQVDLRYKASRKELLSGAEAYSADPYPNKEWSNRISKEAQSIFQAISRWELKQEAWIECNYEDIDNQKEKP